MRALLGSWCYSISLPLALLMKAWKYTGIILVAYSLYAGLMLDVPRLVILNETIRNLYFHVPMWFTMIVLLLNSVILSIRFLQSGQDGLKVNLIFDLKAKNFAEVAMMFSFSTSLKRDEINTTDNKISAHLIDYRYFIVFKHTLS